MNQRKLQHQLEQLDNRRAAGQITAAEYLYRRETLLAQLTPQPRKAKPRWLLPVLISVAVVVVLAAGGGAGGYYFAVYRPHTQAVAASVASAASSKAAYEVKYRQLYSQWHDEDVKLTGLEQEFSKTAPQPDASFLPAQPRWRGLLDTMKSELFLFADYDKQLAELQKQGGDVGTMTFNAATYSGHYKALKSRISLYDVRIFLFYTSDYNKTQNPPLRLDSYPDDGLPDYQGSL